MLCPLLVAANPSSPDPYQLLVRLESTRSPGAGQLASALASADSELSARAALAIGRAKDPAGAALLAAHLHDGRAAVRGMSVYGLGLIATGTAVGAIATALSSDRSGAVRVAAADALARDEAAKAVHGGAEPQAALALVGAMIADHDPVVRGRAAAALEAFRASPMADFVSRALTGAFKGERNDEVRWHIMWTIFRGYAIRVPRAMLTVALRDHNELVRIEAVRAYGRLKSKGAVGALEPLTKDSSWRVQLQALESLRALQGLPPTEHLSSMPPGINSPPVRVQNFMEITPLPRPLVTGKPAAPDAADAIYRPRLNPTTSALMDGPMPGPHPRVRIGTTKGPVVATLYPEWAPLTVENFLNLANRGYYDNLPWYRVVPDFVAQTGGHYNDKGDDTMPVGYTIPAEENPLEQRSYVLSMGMDYKDNAPIRDSAGVEFYITLSPQLHLNRDFTVFGEVTQGFDVFGRLVETDKITRVEQIPDSP